MARKALIQLRRDTSTNWTSVNPTLASGEIGYETDFNRFKVGDGTTAWNTLTYTSAGGMGVGTTPPASPTAGTPWFNTNDGTLYVYYTDANSSQWVQVKANSALEASILSRLSGVESRATALELTKNVVCTSTTRPTSPGSGMTIFETDTGLVYKWNGSSWIEASISGSKVLTGINASNITSGTLGIGVGGTGFTTGAGMTLVKSQAVGSGVSSVTVTGAFNATFDNYKIIYTGGVASTTSYLQLRMGATTTGYYAGLYGSNYSDGTITLANNTNAAAWTFCGTGQTVLAGADVSLFQPYLSSRTFFNATHVTLTAGRNYGGYLDNTTSYTDFTFTCSTGTITGGTIYVYGLSK